MLVLDSTAKSITAKLAAAPATNQPTYVATYADNTGTTFTEGASDGLLNGTTAVTVIAAPAANTRRVIKSLIVENADTAAIVLTITYVNVTGKTIANVTLNPGDTYTLDGTFDNTGSLKTLLLGGTPGSGTVQTVGTGTGLTGGPITSSGTIAIASTGVTAGTYGTSYQIPQFVINAQGQVTSASLISVNAVNLVTGQISTSPVSANDIVNKSYVDNFINGLRFQVATQYATTAALTATYSNGTSGVGATLTNSGTLAAFTLDGSGTGSYPAIAVGTRILVKNQTDQTQNGAYTVTTVGSGAVAWVLTRATDYDQSAEIQAGDFFYNQYGTTNNNTQWSQQTPAPVTLGTSNISFIQFGGGATYTAGTGLTLAGAQFSISNTTVASGTYGTASTYKTITVNAQGQLTNVAIGGNIAIDASQIVTGTLSASRGGTGISSYTANTVVYANATSVLVAGALPATIGGTGVTGYTIGDILYASSPTTLARLPAVAAGNVLISTGVSSAPNWGTINVSALGATTGTGAIVLTSSPTISNATLGTPYSVNLANGVGLPIVNGTTGTLTVARGGTGNTSLTGGSIVIGNFTGALRTLDPGAANTVVTSNGTAFISQAISASAITTGTLGVAYGGTGLTAVGTSGNVLTSNGTAWISQAVAGGLTVQSAQTANFTAVKGNCYPVNTTSAAITATLPATPSTGDQVQFVDYAGTFNLNYLTIARNGNNILGVADNMVLATIRESLILTYVDSTQGWVPTAGLTASIPTTSRAVTYVAVAGGGGGGYYGGGGGAGGILSGIFVPTTGTYTITVGSGGAGSATTAGSIGSNSTISGSIATSIGGGGGGSADSTAAPTAGGSGGGGRASGGGGAAGTTGQGYSGGAAGTNGNGGGGGGGSAGFDASGAVGGNGGNGFTTLISGTSATYAGGGGGGGYSGSGAGSGGTGGGGAGGNPSGAVAGSVNTGGGGGGGGRTSPTSYTGASGGSGIIILSVPTAYKGSVTGSNVVTTTNGNYTVYTFNSSGTWVSP